MPLLKADYEAMMKTHYIGPMRDLLNNTTAFLSRMERYTEPTGGNFLHIPVRTGRTSSIGSRLDTSGNQNLLPTGARPTYNKATFEVRSHYATVRISGLTMRSSRADNFSFARAQTRDMEDTAKDFKKDINRQLFGTGNAELCQVASESGGTFTVTNLYYPTNPTKFLYANQIVDIRTFADCVRVTSGDSITVATVPSTSTFTYTSSTCTGTTSQAVYREDNVSSASSGTTKEMFGLMAAIDDEDPDSIEATGRGWMPNYGNLDRASVTSWQGNVLHNSGTTRPFSVNLIQQGIDTAEEEGGGVISLLQTNYAIWRVYGSLLAAAKTVDMSKMTLDGGWKALDLNGIPMVKDVECPDYMVFCIDESTFMLGITGDWEWIDQGGILNRLVRQDQYEAVLMRDMQLLCDAPNRNTKIEDIAHS